jgi:hypothetical protein
MTLTPLKSLISTDIPKATVVVNHDFLSREMLDSTPPLRWGPTPYQGSQDPTGSPMGYHPRTPPPRLELPSKPPLEHLPLPTPIRVDRLAAALEGYDEEIVAFLVNGFTHGFDLGYVGTPNSVFVHNPPSVSVRPSEMKDYIDKERSAGRIAGPFDTPPFSCFQMSPLGIVPKKNPSEFRIIHNLSFPAGTSINDNILPDFKSVEYATVHDAIALIKSVGVGAFCAKCDIKKAFRLIPLRPDQYHLFCFQFEGRFYFDKCLQMGASSACRIFETFSSALQWVAGSKFKLSYVTHMLDDFFITHDTFVSCSRDLQSFISMCQDLGVPLAPEKTTLPSTTITFLGYEIDTLASEIRLPKDKIDKCVESITCFLSRDKVTLRELQSLIGMLSFAFDVILPGRAFLRRLQDKTIGIQKPHHRIRMTIDTKRDLEVWLIFLRDYNGKHFFLQDWFFSPNTLHLFSDASGNIGYSAVFKTHWFAGLFPDSWLPYNITLKELAPIVLAVEAWADEMRDHCIIFHTDNMDIVHCLNKFSSKEPTVMSLIRRLVLLCLRFNILFKAVHIPGLDNKLADSLSRNNVATFFKLFPEADSSPSSCPALPALLD